MKDFLHGLRHVADQERIDEKSMLMRITVSVCVILFCLTANVVSAYAYFSYTISSGNNTIQAASFYLDVSHEKIEEVISESESEIEIEHSAQETTVDETLSQEGLADEQSETLKNLSVLEQEKGVFSLQNLTSKTQAFYFSIKKPVSENIASVGYAKIEVITDKNNQTDDDTTNDVQKFYTLPIGTYLDPQTGVTESVDSRMIQIFVPAGKAAYVTFVAEWGSCSQEPIVKEGIVVPMYGEIILMEDAEQESQPVESESESEDSQPEEGESESEESQPVESESESEESQPVEGESESEDSQPVEDESEPQDSQPVEGESESEESQPVEGESESEESQPVEDESESEESQPVEGESESQDSQPVEDESQEQESQSQQTSDTDTEEEQDPVTDAGTETVISDPVMSVGDDEAQDEPEGE